MQQFIARENIKRFKDQLESCTDPGRKATLRKLIAAEEARLKQLQRLRPD